MISGITEVVAASLAVIDENVDYSDLIEIAIILNGKYFFRQSLNFKVLMILQIRVLSCL